jgi:endonuclease/exonuclease/phosphatase family metal-dependent hydrolase
LLVKAMTFNIRTSRANDGLDAWDNRAGIVRDTIVRYGPDFVGLQEAWPEQTASVHNGLPDYGYLTRTREVDPCQGEAVPLFYDQRRWVLDCTRSGTFWLSETPDVPGSKCWGNGIPRVATWGHFLEKSSGRGLYVFNAHLDHLSERSRVKSAELIARRIAERACPDPVILLGDMNSGENGGAVRYFKGVSPGATAPLMDTYRKVQPHGGWAGTFHAFTGFGLGRKIDYVFTLPNARVLDARLVRDNFAGRYPSDHFPVVAEMAFPDPPARN